MPIFGSSNIDLGKSTIKEERNVTHKVGSKIIESNYYGEWHNEQFQTGTITFPGPLNNFKIKSETVQRERKEKVGTGVMYETTSFSLKEISNE